MNIELEQIRSQALAEIKAAALETLYDIEVKYLGKKGGLTTILKKLGTLPAEERPAAGKAVNEIKAELRQALDDRKTALKNVRFDDIAENEWIDTSMNPVPMPFGALHPLSLIQYELEDIFTSLGFSIYDGRHIETEYHNFESLNIPADHPARDSHDTFWLKNGNLLRTQTSAVQVQIYKELTPPFRVIVPGRVFRYEAIDATHENTFHQVEGFMVGEDVSLCDMVYVEKIFIERLFGREVEVRLRPGYFPFVEPGYELDFQCMKCAGSGCPLCKGTGWIELLGCGMIHPVVLKNGGIDPEKYRGFAFGVGLDRLVMMRYKINDIRLFQGCDLRQLAQF